MRGHCDPSPYMPSSDLATKDGNREGISLIDIQERICIVIYGLRFLRVFGLQALGAEGVEILEYIYGPPEAY